MNIDRFAHPDFKVPAAIFGALWIAVVLGILAGSGEYEKLKFAAAATMLIVYILFFLRFTWVIALLICFCSFYQVGFGFTISDLEMSLTLGAVVFGATWWRKERKERPAVLQHWTFGLLNTMMLLWLVYVAGHTIFNIYNPYLPQDYALKNLLKVVEAWTGPFLLMLYFSSRTQAIVVKENFARAIAWCLLIGLTVNILIRIWQFFTGSLEQGADLTDVDPENDVMVPGLDLIANVFALRALTPTSMLFAGAIVTTRWFKEQTPKIRFLFYLLMFLSILGAAMSGGRATLAFVLVLFGVMLAMTRRIGLLLASIGTGLILVAAVNVVPGTIKKAPDWVRRSLNWAMIEKDAEMSDSINGSSDWRYTLFRRALDEWQSDPRIFWFGRATYSFGIDDIIAKALQGEDATIESSLRRGSTHNLVTDMLVTFGLVGLTLFSALYWILLYCLWRLYRAQNLSELGRTLALVIFISLAFNFVYGVIGGTNFPPTMAWLYVVLIAYIKRQSRLEEETSRPAIDPPRQAPPNRLSMPARPALRPS